MFLHPILMHMAPQCCQFRTSIEFILHQKIREATQLIVVCQCQEVLSEVIMPMQDWEDIKNHFREN